jgi:hypothetical protein
MNDRCQPIRRARGNLTARSPLMRKGGPHQCSASAIRAGSRRETRRVVDACIEPAATPPPRADRD